MKQQVALRLTPEQASREENYKKFVARKMKVSPSKIMGVRVHRRSIDARQKQVMVQLHVDVWINEKPEPVKPKSFHWPDVSNAPEVIVVGAGPGGLFAALKLVELGLKPIILERGKEVSDRKKDIALLNRNEQLDEDSNYAFGEGGAGTFSDGKLYTRSKKRGDFKNFLEILHFHGASEDVLIDSHPHIGTDRLPGVIQNIRKTITSAGGVFQFNSKVVDLILKGDEITGVITGDGTRISAEAVILATGHSAKDIYYLLNDKGIELEAKTWAMGVRVEHPQELIDQIQYHSPDGRGQYLPAASYSFSHQAEDRGVYSFCMCPGGFIVPAMTSADEMVVNGMSPSKRNSPFANSGMVVEMRPEDVPDYEKLGPVAGLKYQQEIERLCFLNGGQGVIAPAQRLVDFVDGCLSFDLPGCSYVPGTVSAPLHFILPEHITTRLQEGFLQFGKWAKGFLDEDAIILGTESRTSSPVRIPRDKISLEHIRIRRLYPCGEGAGYAGGIASSALDGERCAEKVALAVKTK
ncbi:NAD(P)/FAD-dependent oxidoreductase [Marinilabilia rubra]|uniref:FAD-binding protein n=1 Tax=Marinilabilia rubra TaxID=2162893 RepID=A0A2U2B5M3_9BACT|nr:FAD-dependent oxidoreductase [Marinilabilia rubra]PWD98379.1 FAD-binding protein [Marinilabilia rubra]